MPVQASHGLKHESSYKHSSAHDSIGQAHHMSKSSRSAPNGTGSRCAQVCYVRPSQLTRCCRARGRGELGDCSSAGEAGGVGGRPSRARRRSSWRARQWSRPTCLSCSVRLQGGVAREAKVFSSADSAKGGKARQQAFSGICGFEEAGDGAHEDEWRLACAHAAWRCCGSHG